MSEYEVQSQRSEPAAWPSLVDLAETAVPQAGEQAWQDSPGMRAVYDDLQPLSMTGLNEVSFYGHSLAICEVAKDLRNPTVRHRIVEAGADALIRASEKENGGVSAITMMPFFLEDAYAGLVRDAYERRPAPERLVGEMTLASTFQRRSHERPRFWIPKALREERYARFSEDVLHRMNRHTALDMILMAPQGLGMMVIETGEKSPLMEALIRQNITLSAGHIASLVLQKTTPGIADGELPGQEAIDVLKHHSSKQVALDASRVTSRQFFDADDPVATLVDGQLQFNDPLRGRKPPRPARRRDIRPFGWRGNGYFHRTNERLLCPAEAVHGMVPLSLDLIARMVEVATVRQQSV